jgi:hypothetical protein
MFDCLLATDTYNTMFATSSQECTTLKLLEIDPTKLPGPIEWVVGKMGDPEPTATSATTIHYLIPDGCVHVYVASPILTLKDHAN